MYPSITISAAAGTARGNTNVKRTNVQTRNGIQLPDLERMRSELVAQGFPTEIVDLSHGQGVAHVLVARGVFAGSAAEQELQAFPWPQTKGQYGQVVNCINNFHGMVCGFRQEADASRELQQVAHWEDMPATAAIRERLVKLLGREMYFDIIAYPGERPDTRGAKRKRKATPPGGIAFHGDAERCLLAGVRFGELSHEYLLRFMWFHQTVAVSPEFAIRLSAGDLYVSCEKATGWDFHAKNTWCLRHAAGRDDSGCLVEHAKRRAKRASMMQS